MTEEQIERILRLVRDYGDCLCTSMEPKHVRDTEGPKFWQDRAEAVYERIEAELKGGGTDG